MSNSITLSEAELFEITHYKRPSEQLSELHRQGFYRARRGRDGSVILERAHHDAVCRGKEPDTPKVRPPKLRTATA